MDRRSHLLYLSFVVIVVLWVAHLIGGYFYLYWTEWWYDYLTHFLGGLGIGLFSLWIVYSSGFFKEITVSPKKVFFVCILSVLVVGSFWELFEYVNDLTQSTEGYKLDVVHDLLADLVGALVSGFIGVRKINQNG